MFDTVLIEGQENYVKTSYRNRCHIATVNGVQRLSIPLRRGKNNQTSIRDVHIAYDEPWAAIHWKSIVSAYSNSPYFKFYKDDLKPYFLHKRYEYVWDFNFDLLLYFVHTIGIDTRIDVTHSYFRTPPPGVLDFRGMISPKNEDADPTFRPQHYSQVFEDRLGFQPNLSILDLLLCCGRATKGILKQCIVEMEE